MPIPIPSQVKVEIEGSMVRVHGPKGVIERSLPQDLVITQEDGELVLQRPSDSRLHRSLHGLSRSLVANMVQGVSQGFEKSLEVSGVGYRVQKKGQGVSFQLGFSHPAEVVPPAGIELAVEGTTRVKVTGINKELVGQVAARIRAIAPPDHYKGKGIRYSGETVRLKAGKAGKVARKK